MRKGCKGVRSSCAGPEANGTVRGAGFFLRYPRTSVRGSVRPSGIPLDGRSRLTAQLRFSAIDQNRFGGDSRGVGGQKQHHGGDLFNRGEFLQRRAFRACLEG